MGRPKAGTISTGKRSVELVRVDPDAVGDTALFDDASIDVHASVPLQDLLQTIGADSPDGSVTVSRINIKPGGARVEEYLFAGQPSGDLLNDLQSDYGPGTYNVKVYARDTDGVKACRANKTVTIGPLPASKLKAAEVATVAPAQDRIAEVLAQMAKMHADSQSQMFTVLTSIIQGGQANRGSDLAGFKTFAESVGLMQKNAPATPGPLDMLGALQAMLKMVREISPAPADALPRGEDGDIGPNALLAQGMQMFAKILELAKQGNPQAASLPAIAQSSPPIAPIPLAGVSGNGAQNVTQTQHNPAPQVDPSPEDEDAMMLQLFLKRLVSAARRADPVEGYAEQLDPLISEEAETLIRSPEWFAALCGMNEACAPYQAWFARLREALLKLLNETDGEIEGGEIRSSGAPPAIN